MNRRVAFGLTAVWLAALCVSAQAVMLRYTPKVGSKASYDHAMTSTTSGTMAGETFQSQSSMKMTTTYKVLAQTPKGVRVEVATRNGTMTMTMPGAKSPMTQKVPDMTSTAVMDAQGRMQEAKTSGGDPQAAAMSNDLLSGMSGFGMLPKAEVKPGATWSDSVDVKATGTTPGMKLTFTSRLVELTTYQGRRCAKISTTFKGTLSGIPGSAGAGNMQGTATQYYDYENSLWVDIEAKMTMTMKLPNPEGKGAGGSMLMKSTTTVKLKK